ncbi:MAG: hypothetical protein ACK4WH_03365 [Phycisphaerales bacterium]
MTENQPQQPECSWLRTLGWAAYLACSWTWCIGMFLPVLLVRDYGAWAFVAFAVPNVLGAAAMGWVLSPGSSLRVVQTHRLACAAFSLVTIAFQLFFFSGLREPLRHLGSGHSFRAREFLAAAVISTIATLALGAPRAAAGAVWVISALLLGFVAWQLGVPDLPALGDLPQSDLLFLAPVCAFGFLLCPYLDLTFHRARQAAGDSGRAAFGLGFGVMFFAMITGTLVYALPALGWMTQRSLPERFIAAAIVAHIALQLAVTVVFHADEFDSAYQRSRSARLTATAVGAILLILAVASVSALKIESTLSLREVVYRLFMSFYGLVFPAYVWLCMIPVRGEVRTRPPSRQKLTTLAASCVLAAPCYWMGFIGREAVWLVPGLGIVLTSRLFIRRGTVSTVPLSPASTA